MHYFEVFVAGGQYHGQGALTYSHGAMLGRGVLVSVPLRAKRVLGIINKQVPKPPFAVKPIAKSFALPPMPETAFDLMNWLSTYYPAPLGAITQLFLPKSLSEKRIDEAPASVEIKASSAEVPPLTSEQAAALRQIDGAGTFILHGETGTGKTRVYAELARHSLADKRSAIILTPEIGLTSQLATFFRSVFGERVVVLHSQLTDVARERAWLRAAQSKGPLVIIGARSALFSPLKDIGLIVVDEAHEAAYKQDQAPHYLATRVAAKLGQLHKSIVVLGSATPPLVEYFLAEQKNRPIVRMERLARGDERHKTHIEIIDLKDRTQFSKSPYLSKALLGAIAGTLGKHEQVLLFLNRRGTARVVFCERCGWQANCPRCDLPLVYHGDNHTMRCHTCGFQQAAASSCPECGNSSIVFKTIGTKAIAAEVKSLFPEARMQRFDTDNKRSERMERHYEALQSGSIDILVGTQTLAKGLDLPKLGLVGVVVADTSLYLPDYGSQERTYQLLAQILGRVGRGHRESQAIIQTYAPQNPILKAVRAKEWRNFYIKELAERRAFLFPPFCYILKLSCRRVSPEAARKAAEKFAAQLQIASLRVTVEGPAPSFHEKIMGRYQWQLIVKAKDRAELLRIIPMLPSGWSYDIDPANLL